jgi:hypothetical protein
VIVVPACRQNIVVRQLMDDALCCALHPAGGMLLVGCHDRLRGFAIALEDL